MFFLKLVSLRISAASHLYEKQQVQYVSCGLILLEWVVAGGGVGGRGMD